MAVSSRYKLTETTRRPAPMSYHHAAATTTVSSNRVTSNRASTTPLGNLTSALSASELEDRLLRMAEQRGALQLRNNELEDKLKKVGARYLRLLKSEAKQPTASSTTVLEHHRHLHSPAATAGSETSTISSETSNIGGHGHLATHERDALATHITKVEKENNDLKRLVQVLRVENQRFNSSVTNFNRSKVSFPHIGPRIDTGLANASLSRLSQQHSTSNFHLHAPTSTSTLQHNNNSNAGGAALSSPSSVPGPLPPASATASQTQTQSTLDFDAAAVASVAEQQQQQQNAAAATAVVSAIQQQHHEAEELLYQYTQLIQRLDEKCNSLQHALNDREQLMEQLTARLRTQHERICTETEHAFENNVKLIRTKRELETLTSELRAAKTVRAQNEDNTAALASLKNLTSTLEADNTHLKQQLDAERERNKQLRQQATNDSLQNLQAQQYDKRNAFLEKECSMLREQNEALLKNVLDAQSRVANSTNVSDTAWQTQLDALKTAHQRQLDERSTEFEQLKHDRIILSERLRLADEAVDKLKSECEQQALELRTARQNYTSMQAQLDTERREYHAEVGALRQNVPPPKPVMETKSIETLRADFRNANTSPASSPPRRSAGTNKNTEDLHQKHKKLLKKPREKNQKNVNKLMKELLRKYQRRQQQHSKKRSLLESEFSAADAGAAVFAATPVKAASNLNAAAGGRRSAINFPATTPSARNLHTARSRMVELFIKSFQITVDDYFFVERQYFLSIKFLLTDHNTTTPDDSPLVRVNELDATMTFSYRAKYVLPMYGTDDGGDDNMLSILNSKRIEFYLFEVFKAEKSLVAQTVLSVDQLTFEKTSSNNGDDSSSSSSLTARATVGLYSDSRQPTGLLTFQLSYRPFAPEMGKLQASPPLSSNISLNKNIQLKNQLIQSHTRISAPSALTVAAENPVKKTPTTAAVALPASRSAPKPAKITSKPPAIAPIAATTPPKPAAVKSKTTKVAAVQSPPPPPLPVLNATTNTKSNPNNKNQSLAGVGSGSSSSDGPSVVDDNSNSSCSSLDDFVITDLGTSESDNDDEDDDDDEVEIDELTISELLKEAETAAAAHSPKPTPRQRRRRESPEIMNENELRLSTSVA